MPNGISVFEATSGLKGFFSKMDPVVLQNFVDLLPVFWPLLEIISFLVGFILIGWGILCWAQPGKGFVGVVAVIAGGMLTNVPMAINMFSGSFLAVSAPTDMLYVAPASVNKLHVTAAIRMIVLLGFASFFRAWIYIKDWALEQRPAHLYMGLTLLLGGVACMNIVKLLKAIGNTLGGDALNMVTTYL